MTPSTHKTTLLPRSHGWSWDDMCGGYLWHEMLLESRMRAVLRDRIYDMYALYELVAPVSIYRNSTRAGVVFSLLACHISKTEAELLLDNNELTFGSGAPEYLTADLILTDRNINIYTMHSNGSPMSYFGSSCIDCLLDFSSHIRTDDTDPPGVSRIISGIGRMLSEQYATKYPQFSFTKEES